MILVRGGSSFWHKLLSMFPQVQGFFAAKLGNGSSFRFWKDGWFAWGPLWKVYPCLFALALNPKATIVDFWDATWCPIQVGHLSDQLVDDLTPIQQSLLRLGATIPSCPSGASDVWIWSNCPFLVQSTYRQLRGAS